MLFIQVCSDHSPRHCSTVQGKMPSTLLSAALQTRLTAGLCHCNALVEICSSYRYAVTRHQCTATLFRANCSPLLSAALQDRLAAGLYHCNYTHEDLLFIQVCSDPTPVHCNFVQGKLQSPAQCCSARQACSRLVSLQSHPRRFAVHTGVQ